MATTAYATKTACATEGPWSSAAYFDVDGTLVDTDQNGVPDWCDSCTGDVNGDGTVDAADLGALLALWGTNANSSPRADANRDGTVDAADLGLLLGYWGDCP